MPTVYTIYSSLNQCVYDSDSAGAPTTYAPPVVGRTHLKRQTLSSVCHSAISGASWVSSLTSEMIAFREMVTIPFSCGIAMMCMCHLMYASCIAAGYDCSQQKNNTHLA